MIHPFKFRTSRIRQNGANGNGNGAHRDGVLPRIAEAVARDPRAGRPTPAVSVVVPTRAEAENVGALVARLERVLPDLPLEIIFVDDSDDDTPDAIRASRPRGRST